MSCRLKLREMLMPQVVDQTGDMRNALAKRGPGLKSWKVNPALFPCELSDEAMGLAKDAGGFCDGSDPGGLAIVLSSCCAFASSAALR